MNLYGIPSIAAFFFTLLLGTFVYVKNTKNILNQAFFRWLLALSVWHFGSAATYYVSTPVLGLVASRITHAGAILIPATFLHFILAILAADRARKRLIVSSYVFSFLLEIVNLTPFFIKDVSRLSYNYYGVPGGVYYFFIIFFFGIVIYCHFCLYKSIAHANGRKKTQLKYLFIASLIGYTAGGVDFLPIFGIDVYAIGNPVNIAFVSLVAYAIVRHHLMDIEVIVKKTIVFGGIVAIAACAISIPIGILQAIFGRAVGITPLVLMVSGIATTALIYRPLAEWLTDLTDRYLFQKKIGYRALLKEATEYLAELSSLKWQARRVIAFLVYKARIKNASIYAFQSFAPGSLLLQASRPRLKADGHRTILLSHPMVTYMLAQVPRGAIQLVDVEAARKQTPDRWKQKELWEIIHLLKTHQAEAAIPCFVSDTTKRARKRKQARDLRGILFLGPQKSDEPYQEEDLDVFFTLGQESSIAFENARLFDEALQRAQELQAINQELNDAQTDLLRALHDAEKSRKEAECSREEALEANRKREELEDELIQAERERSLGRMVGGLAHEVRNPLSYTFYTLHYLRSSVLPLIQELSERAGLSQSMREKASTVSETLGKYLEQTTSGTERIRTVVETAENFPKRKEIDAKDISAMESKKPGEKLPMQSISLSLLMNLLL